jgi:SDR family mycofactocin-dependent oxidoreductase
MTSLAGKVAFVTGAARGQGRSHAIRLASAGADIIAGDICRQIDSVAYPMSTPADLDVTVKEVEALGCRIYAAQVDVRDEAQVAELVASGTNEIGPIDIIVANAGIAVMTADPAPTTWRDVIDVNLSGVFHTIEAAYPGMVERGAGGSIVITGSTAALSGIGGGNRGSLAYVAAKHGLVGLMRSYANNLAPHSIRVNIVHPTGVGSPMIQNDATMEFLNSEPAFTQGFGNALPVDMIEPSDVSEAVAWLASDLARYVTGVSLPVDAGFTNKR